MNSIFRPLFGDKPKEDGKNSFYDKIAEKAPEIPKQVEIKTSQNPIPQIMNLPNQRDLQKIKSQLGGLIDDNKIVILVVLFVIILLVLAFLLYKQKTQTKSLAVMHKKLLRMKMQ